MPASPTRRRGIMLLAALLTIYTMGAILLALRVTMERDDRFQWWLIASTAAAFAIAVRRDDARGVARREAGPAAPGCLRCSRQRTLSRASRGRTGGVAAARHVALRDPGRRDDPRVPAAGRLVRSQRRPQPHLRASANVLRIKCLGQLSVLRDDGQPLAGAASQPRRLAILAVLARAGDRGVTREKVIGYLWPDSDEERARRLLSQAVYMLRRDLGSDDAILGVRDLRLGPDIITSDVAEFQDALDARTYEKAATLYGGPFLDGFHLPGAAEFERWVDEERRALEHDGNVAFEKCATAAEARGDHGNAVIWWRKMAGRTRSMRALRSGYACACRGG